MRKIPFTFSVIQILSKEKFIYISVSSRERWVWGDRCQSKEKKEAEDSQFPSFLFKSYFLCPVWNFFSLSTVQTSTTYWMKIERVGVRGK